MDFEKLNIIECPYMPEGFTAIDDGNGIAVLNTAIGVAFRLPKLSLVGPTELPRDFMVEGDRLIGDMVLKYQWSR